MKSFSNESKLQLGGLENALSEILTKRNSFVSLFHSYQRVQDQIDRHIAHRSDECELEKFRTIQSLLMEIAACLPAHSKEELKYKLELYRLAGSHSAHSNEMTSPDRRGEADRRAPYH